MIFSYKCRKTYYTYSVKIRITYGTQKGGTKGNLCQQPKPLFFFFLISYLAGGIFWRLVYWNLRTANQSLLTRTKPCRSWRKPIIIRSAWRPRWHNNNNGCMSCTKKRRLIDDSKIITTSVAAMTVMAVANTNSNNSRRSWIYIRMRRVYRGQLPRATFVTWRQLVPTVKSPLTVGIFKC